MTRKGRLVVGLAAGLSLFAAAWVAGGLPESRGPDEEQASYGTRETPGLEGRPAIGEVVIGSDRRLGPVAVLPGEPTVELRLLDEQGAPLPLARFSVSAPTIGTLVLAEARGTVVLGKRWVDARATVHVDAPRDASGKALPMRPLVARLGPGGAGLELRMDHGRAVEVTVLDDAGRPAAKAHVHVASTDPDDDEAETFWSTSTWAITDEHGLAAFVGLPRVNLDVEVMPEASWFDPSLASLPLGETRVTVVRNLGPSIDGRVVTPDGRVVAGVRVKACGWHEGTWWEQSSVSDAVGAFRIASLPPKASPRVIAEPPEPLARELGVTTTTRDDLKPGARDVELRLDRAAAIRGEVVDEAGRAVAGFEVFATPKGASEAESEDPTPGTNRFAFEGLRPGRYVVEAVRRGDPPGRSRPVEVDAPAAGVRLVLDRAQVVAGRILGERAKGYAAWWFGASLKAHAAVDPDDTFRIAGVRDERGTLYVGSERTNRYALLRDVRPSAAPLDVELVEGQRIAGKVELPEGEAPSLVYVVFDGGGFELWAEMEADRTFRVLGVPPGSYEVSLCVDDVRGETLGRASAGAADVLVRYARR